MTIFYLEFQKPESEFKNVVCLLYEYRRDNPPIGPVIPVLYYHNSKYPGVAFDVSMPLSLSMVLNSSPV